MKEKSNEKTLYVIIGVLCFVVVGLSIAFAALSSQLNINFGAVSQGDQTWNVAFETNNSIQPVVFGTSDVGRNCGNASASLTQVSISNTNLSKPDDGCRWPLKIKNTGTITAKLSSIIFTQPTGINDCVISEHESSMVCGNITYKLTKDVDGTILLSDATDIIEGGTDLPVYMFALYTGADVSGTQIQHSDVSLELNFSQQ